MTALERHSLRDNSGEYAQLIGAWLASYGSPATRSAYRTDVRIFLKLIDAGNIDLLEVRREHVDTFVRAREQIDTPSTLRRRIAAVSALYRYAMSEGLIQRNPVEAIRRPVVDQDHSASESLTHAEAVRFLDGAKAHSPRTHALVLLLLDTGIRISEALGTTEADLGAETIKIRRKGGKSAIVPISTSLKTLLRELTGTTGAEVARGDEPSRPIFRTRTGAGWKRTDSARVMRVISQKAGIEKVVTPHVLRHTHATLALAHGVPLHHLQDSLGHSDPRTTRRYDHDRSRLENHSANVVSRIFD